jgi:hypothetical protein
MALRLYACFLLLSLPYASCDRAHRTTVEFYIVDGYRFSQAERDLIQNIADSTAGEVEQLLPALPTRLVLKVQAGRVVNPDTGDAASLVRPNIVHWTVDPHRAGGVPIIAEAELRRSLFPVWHYLVRTQTLDSTLLMDQVIAQGMAMAFARDFAGAPAARAEHVEDVSAWAAEVIALPPSAPLNQWMDRHPDGQRSIGLRVGTYLVDRAIKSSGRSSAQLVATPTEDVLRLAGMK